MLRSLFPVNLYYRQAKLLILGEDGQPVYSKILFPFLPSNYVVFVNVLLKSYYGMVIPMFCVFTYLITF